MENKRYRYPGIRSFETEDSEIFFGREDDRKKLADIIDIEKMVLLYSRSGLGKSSLAKAALIPELKTRGYQTFYIRLGLYQPGSFSPVQNILKRTVLAQQKEVPASFLQKFINYNNSLWYAFKAMQVTQDQLSNPVVLVFDQFEEISSYPTKHFNEFKQQLAELLFTTVPKDYQEALEDDILLEEPLTENELQLLYKPLRIKVVFLIRSDQLSVLNEFSDCIPNILKSFYELKSLTSQQALSAIQQPAKKEGPFITPPFNYRQQATDKILTALTSERNNEIDSAQLQILLQHIEQDIVEKKNDTDITEEDLGDLNKVYENYYNNSLRKLSGSCQQAQELIEDKLIVDGRRISYDKALCLKMVDNDILNTLIETRLLRQEPNTTGGYSYEISHDSLVAPIMDARAKRIQRELEAKKEYERAQEEAAKKAEYELRFEEQRKKQHWQRMIIYIVSAASVIAIALGIFAFSEKTKAVKAQNDAELSLKEVNRQKLETQKALSNFIGAEVRRKELEKQQLLIDAKAYVNSGDKALEKIAGLRVDSLNMEISKLTNQLKQLR